MDNAGLPLVSLTALSFSLIVIGTLLTLVLYNFDWNRFRNSTVAVKILMWVPIYVVFLGVLIVGPIARVLLFILISAKSLREVLGSIKRKSRPYYFSYWALFVFWLFHIALYSQTFGDKATMLIITIAFGSVLSDVVAFFMGNFLGKHKLPPSLNKAKSYEGVVGQFIGAFIGVILIRLFIVDIAALIIFVPISLGSLIGDLTNSFIKRKAGIKDWGSGLPGHGGYIDRLSSLVAAFTLTYYALLLFAGEFIN